MSQSKDWASDRSCPDAHKEVTTAVSNPAHRELKPTCQALNSLTARAAREYRRDRDRHSPLRRDLAAERASLCRDFIGEALEPVGYDWQSCIAALESQDDVAVSYHMRRMVICLKHATFGLRGLSA